MSAQRESHETFMQTLDQPIRLPVFEGPLDLLLFLIRKNEVEIYDIPIEKVTQQYLEILYSMEQLKLEVAGEFFVMAATLMQIKSRMLLPRDERLVEAEEEEEETDPRWELVQQLLEYRKFKDAAGQLQELVRHAQDLLPRYYQPAKDDEPERPLQPVDRIDLWNAFNRVLRRLSEKITVGNIEDETVSVSDRMEVLLKALETRPQFSFSSLFENTRPSVHTLVATFIALLELTRLSRITIAQEDNFADITITRREQSTDSDDGMLNAPIEMDE